jgi:hypothetical protein
VIKPNDAARAQMRKTARDMQALIEHNEKIEMEWRTMVVALEAGDVAGAQAARVRANSMIPEGAARCEVAELSWRGIAGLDPVAWADVHRDQIATRPPPVDLKAALMMTAENAVELAGTMGLEVARTILAAHRSACSHPACPISRALMSRIAELGGTP